MIDRSHCHHSRDLGVDGLCAVCLLNPTPDDYVIITVVGRGPHTIAYLAYRVGTCELVVAKVGPVVPNARCAATIKSAA